MCIQSRVQLNVLTASKTSKFDSVNLRVSHELLDAVIFLLKHVFFQNNFLWGHFWEGVGGSLLTEGIWRFKILNDRGSFKLEFFGELNIDIFP